MIENKILKIVGPIPKIGIPENRDNHICKWQIKIYKSPLSSPNENLELISSDGVSLIAIFFLMLFYLLN